MYDRPTISNQNQELNHTGNVSFILDSERRLVVLALRDLLSNKKSLIIIRNGPHVKIGINNKELEL